jgi:uncharacterized protein (TIGR03086 family)
MTIDLEPAAKRMAALVRGVAPARLGDPTPCPGYMLGDLVDHIGGLTVAFAAVARKDLDDPRIQGAPGDASRLGDDWQSRIPRDLDALVAAWRDPSAWTGMTRAGGLDLPGEVAGVVVLDELVVHGWDLARASGQDYECDDESLAAVHGFVQQFSGPGTEGTRAGLFGPEVSVPEGATLLDRVIGMTGRDPAWAPASAS